jgi:peptidoglycan/LPS O-acetylase OafA/YrhL
MAERPRIDALDGLRALAVLAVLAYHLDDDGLSGGFLGVSTFFTLSGFLITTLLLGESRRTGRVDLKAFWVRRVRRLLPASLATMAAVATLGAAGMWTASQTSGLRFDVTASLAYLANWRFALEGGGYVEQMAAPSPLLHFWSLSIEEQFYLFFPVFAWALIRRRALMAGVVGAAVAVSVALPVAAGWSIDRTYLGTDARAAELLVGVLLALACHATGLAGPNRGRRALAVLAPLCLLAQAAAWLFLDDTGLWLTRGGLALYAVATSIVILGLLVPGPLRSLLAWRPLVWIGRISYGLYLYHWPIILLVTDERTGLAAVPLACVQVGLSIGLAAISFRFLEEPIRTGRFIRPRRSAPMIGLMACGIVGAGALLLPSLPAVDVAGMKGGDVQPDASPPPIAAAPRWRVAIATDRHWRPLVDGLLTVERKQWDVVTVLTLDCQPDEHDCGYGSWAEELERVKPDALVAVTDIVDYRAALAVKQPGATVLDGDAIDWAVERFGTALAASATAGRTVMWVTPPTDGSGERSALSDAAWSFERRLTARWPQIVRESIPEQSASALAAPIDIHALAATDAAETRIMVVGDSVAAGLAEGLSTWGVNRRIAAWNNSKGGCGVLTQWPRIGLDGGEFDESQCAPWRRSWAEAAANWRAQVIVVLVAVWDLADRRIGEQVRRPGDPVFDDTWLAGHRELAEQARAAGISLILATPPCVGYDGARVPGGAAQGHPLFSGERQRYARQVLLPRLQREDGTVRVFDFSATVCAPDGAFLEQRLADGALVRPDGLHLSARGARAWATDHGAALLELAAPRANG